MKLVTFNSDGTDRVGVILGDEVAPLDAATTPAFASLRSLLEAGPDALDAAGRAGNEAAERLPLAGLRLRAPIPRPVQMRDALCFEKHLRQARANRYLFGQGTARVPPEEIEVPQVWYDQPIYYKGNRFAVSGPEDEILWPKGETKLDYELEIAAVIGHGGRDIPASDARRHIAGYMIFNDFSSRDYQIAEMAGTLGPAKGTVSVSSDELRGRTDFCFLAAAITKTTGFP
jgi:2-keto-4-pentenoate hydratase/2-oxohepta-3-ene-1,7-dioic acid hydratase in catechol pathway